MAYEATDSIVNMYSLSHCRLAARNVACELPTDLQKSTYLRIYTTSTALEDNSLKLSEITGVWIYMAVDYDTVSKAWKPGWLELNMSTDASGLVATKFADGWRLYSSARIKALTEKWCGFNCEDSGYAHTYELKFTSDWYQILQIEANEYSGQTSVPDRRRYLFLAGPFVELPPAG